LNKKAGLTSTPDHSCVCAAHELSLCTDCVSRSGKKIKSQWQGIKVDLFGQLYGFTFTRTRIKYLNKKSEA